MLLCIRVCVLRVYISYVGGCKSRYINLSPRYDYFIVSQSVRQGTVTPTHFNVICDSSGLKPDHMQRLTYKLCHLYYNWPVGEDVMVPLTRTEGVSL